VLLPKVLVVNDDSATLLALESLLTGSAWANVCTVVKVQSGEEALRQVLTQDFAVILLDVNMPGMDGFETAEAIHFHPRSAATPIIFTTAYYNDDLYRLKGYQNGAVDYLLTPVIPQILQTKVSVFVELAQKRLELQSKTEQLASLNHDLNLRHNHDVRRINAILESTGGERRRSERRRVGRRQTEYAPEQDTPPPAKQTERTE
jgi:diguanylate cyclase